jgi:phosphotransacetylase
MEEDHDVSSKMMTEQIVQKALEDPLIFAPHMVEDHDVHTALVG